MYPILHQIFADHKGDVIFTCFGLWHLLYMALIFGVIVGCVFAFKKRSNDAKKKCIRVAAAIAFGLYIADFFLMPFAYGQIDLEKLPFHMCTLMCILCFLSCHGLLLPKCRKQFALLGLVSNLIYVIYPAGVGSYQIHPLSYRVVQTLLFHGSMSAYGIFTLALGEEKLTWKSSLQEVPVIAGMTLWALLGNTLYNGTAGEYSHMFNWFFVIRDPFYILPEQIAPYVMPFIMVIVIYTADLLVYGAYFGMKKLASK